MQATRAGSTSGRLVSSVADFEASGLGLPDRDYYFDASDRMEMLRVAYRAHIANLLKLANIDAADEKAAAIFDLELLQHLADDHLDMLVVYLHALETIDLLDFIDQIDGELFHALDAQNVMR